MKILKDNVLYEFIVQQENDQYPSSSDSDQLLRVGVRYRRFQHPLRRPVSESEQSFDIPRNANDRCSARALMSRILSMLEIPNRVGEDMAMHFKFRTDTIRRRIGSRGGVFLVEARLNVKVLPSETATGIRGRMHSARSTMEERAPRQRVVTDDDDEDDEDDEDDDEAEQENKMVPARRSAIEGLEKVVVSTGGGCGECSICLEELREGAPLAKMPCSHVYHNECIVRWLDKTHFCPCCRFKMPC